MKKLNINARYLLTFLAGAVGQDMVGKVINFRENLRIEQQK